MEKINILSRRAQDILSSPIYRSFKRSENDWTIVLEKSEHTKIENDKILTLSYFLDEGSPVELLFYETLARLTLQKKMGAVINLGYRETESFLRDENHLPLFDKSHEDRTMLIFDTVKNSLLVAVIREKLSEMGNAHRFLLSKAWSKYTLVEKNRAVFQLVELINSLFSEEKHLKLVLVDPAEIFIKKDKCPLDLKVIEDIVGDFLGLDSQLTPLKVVAVQ